MKEIFFARNKTDYITEFFLGPSFFCSCFADRASQYNLSNSEDKLMCKWQPRCKLGPKIILVIDQLNAKILVL